MIAYTAFVSHLKRSHFLESLNILTLGKSERVVHVLLSTGSDEDLEYFVRECGDILAVTNKLPQEKRSAKDILEYVLHQVVEFKKLNQVSPSCTAKINT